MVRCLFLSALCGASVSFITATGFCADDPASVRKLLITGEYDGVITAAKAGAQAAEPNPEWPLLLGTALTETGDYAGARDALSAAAKMFPLELRVRLADYEALQRSGDTEKAVIEFKEIERLATMREWAYRAPADRIALGRAVLLLGSDPKQVLEKYFDPVRKDQPDFRESWIASGELALDKNDYALAAKTFGAAAKKFPEDPDIWFGLARSYAPSDPEAMRDALQKALQFNSRHTGAWLLLADHHIDAENYPAAEAAIGEALKINPHLPEAFAYRAVLANLQADVEGERTAREEALKPWPKNPAVPHLVGRKLSQKYRFAEGAALQRKALEFDPGYLPAKMELANDLLRLGQDEEGWKLADEVHLADPYDVVAYNLTQLHEAIAHFRTFKSEHFDVRMDPHEAEVYGADVLALLERAHATLTKKYGLPLTERTIVEIFPDQKDFAIRTFGLPGGAGYLGVCFGRVITANSPASRQGSPSNWESVLWHEFTHVVTLTLTRNKMPRWLSEGISVYEERQARGSWGEQMKPRYRAMILGEDLTPVSQLSGSFLHPKSAAHLGFAYYESSLVVDWLVGKWGLEKMKELLADLAEGTEINAALAARFEPIEKLDADFAAHAVELAKNTGAGLDWTRPTAANFAGEKSLNDFIAKNPNNFTALLEQAKQAITAKKWTEAKTPLLKLIELYPDQHDPNGAYAMLARVHRELGETDEEWAVLTKLAELSGDAPDAYERLAQIAAERTQWDKVLDYSMRALAVDPLRPEPYLTAAAADEALKHNPEAIAAYRTVLKLNPNDPPEIHFRLARLLHAGGDSDARREVLLALEEAPRFRAALDLLLEIPPVAPASSDTPAPAPPAETKP